MNIKRAVDSQKVIANILKSSYINDRLSHAYLFHGAKGTGKKELAYSLACMLYCENGGCLECPTCKTIIDGNHMNVNYIGILEDKTKISKEQIMDLQDEFSKTSFVNGTRVYIVDGIDTATSAAQNSLLKFIEEPQNQTPTIGIFLAEEISNVVSTIQSRCEVMHFEALPKQVMVESLIEEGIEKLDAILLSELTNDLDEAKDIHDKDSFYMLKGMFLNLIEIDTKRNAVIFYVQNVNYFYEDPSYIETLLKWVLLFLEDSNLSENDTDNLILSPLCDKIEKYRKRTKDLRKKLEYYLELLRRLSINISPKNVFFELVDKFC